MYHFLLSFPVGKVPYLSSDLYEPKYPISCMSFAASSAHVRARQVWQTTKLNLSRIPTGHSLQAVTRARTSYWKTAVLSTGQVFLFVMPAVISKSCLILTSDLFLISSFCIKQTTEVPLAAASDIQMTLSSGSRLHFLFQVNAGWFLPHPPLCFWALCYYSASCGFPPSGFWLLASCDRECWFPQA